MTTRSRSYAPKSRSKTLAKTLGIGLALAFGLRAPFASARAFVWPETDNEWHSAQTAALGGVGALSENFVDGFFADPSQSALDKSAFEMSIVSFNPMYSRDLANTISDFRSALSSSSSSSSSSGVNESVALLDKMQALFGRHLTGGGSVSLLATRIRNFTIVPFATMLASGEVDVPAYPQATLGLDSYVGVGLGYSHAFGPGGRFQWGLSLRPGVRSTASASPSLNMVGQAAGVGTAAPASAPTASSIARYGSGLFLPVDVAFGYLVRQNLRLDLVAQNLLFGSALNRFAGDSNPPSYDPRLTLGAVYVPWEQGNHRVRLGTELQDLTHLFDKAAFWYRWRLGGQYLYKLPFRSESSFGLSAGLGEGYPSIGALIDLFIVRLEATVYTREAGYYISQAPERRYSFRMSSQFSF